MTSAYQGSRSEKSSEMAELNSTWGMLIDEGLQEAQSTLAAMDSGASGDGNRTREAWMMVDRAFQSSAKALRALII